MSVHGGDVFFDIKANQKPFNKAMAGLETTSTKLAGKISGSFSSVFSAGMQAAGEAGASALAVGLTAGIALVVAGAVAGALKVSKLGDEIDKMSQRVGMSTEAYQKWDYVMNIAGTEMQNMRTGLKTLTNKIDDAKNGSAKAQAMFARLGISMNDLNTMSREQIFEKTITGFQGMADSTSRAALANDLFGKSGQELAPLFNMTTAETQRLMAYMESMGAVMSERGVKNCAALRDAIFSLKTAFRGLGNVLAEYVVPILTFLINYVIIPIIKGLTKTLNALFGALDQILSKFKWFRKFKEKYLSDEGINTKESQDSFYDTADAIDTVADSIEVTGGNVKATKKEVKALKRELLGFDKITKLSGENKTSNDTGLEQLGTSISTPSSVADAYNDIAEAAENATKKQEESKKSLKDLIKGFQEKHPILSEFLKSIVAMPLVIADAIVAAWPKIKKFFKKVWETVSKFAGKVWSGLKNIVAGKLPKALSDATEKVKTWWKKQKKKFGAFTTSIKTKFEESKIGKAWKNFTDKHPWIKEGLKLAVKLAFPGLSIIQAWWKKIKDWLENHKINLSGVLFGGVGSALAGLIKKDEKPKENAGGNWLSRLWDNTMEKIAGVPAAANGTVVKRNSPQLAIIGDNKREGEVVAPDSKLQAMANAAAGGGNAEMIRLLQAILTAIQTQDTSVYLDGEQIKNNVVRRLNAHTRATGQPELIY